MKVAPIVYVYRWRWNRLEVVPMLEVVGTINRYFVGLPIAWLTLEKLQARTDWDGLERTQPARE